MYVNNIYSKWLLRGLVSMFELNVIYNRKHLLKQKPV